MDKVMRSGRSPVRRNLLAAGALLILASGGALVARGRSNEPGDVNSLLGAYSRANQGFEQGRPTQDARRQFYRQWLSTLYGACEQLPPDEVPESARFTCLALANGAEDYALAEVIAVDGSIHATHLRDRLSYWDQRVALREVAAARTGSDDDRAHVQQTVDEALALVRPTFGDPLFQEDAVSALSEIGRAHV